MTYPATIKATLDNCACTTTSGMFAHLVMQVLLDILFLSSLQKIWSMWHPVSITHPVWMISLQFINYHALRVTLSLFHKIHHHCFKYYRLRNTTTWAIKVFWLGSDRPALADLKPFLLVWKAKVLAALEYLVRHNHLYHNIMSPFYYQQLGKTSLSQQNWKTTSFV